MLPLLKQSIKFYKLAEDTVWDEEDKKIYEAELKAAPGYSRRLVVESIAHFIDAPFFDFDAWGKILMKSILANNEQLDDITAEIEALRAYKIEEYVPYVIGELLDHHSEFIFSKMLIDPRHWHFVNFAHYVISSGKMGQSYVRKFKLDTIKHIVEAYRNGNTGIITLLLELLENGNVFDSKLLWRLINHLGPEVYGKIVQWEQLNGHEHLVPPRIDPANTTKQEFNSNDIAVMFQRRQIFTPKIFNQLVEKATPKAKEYLRTFLYITAGRPEDGDMFILDEEFKPIGNMYESVKFPPYFQAILNWNIMNEDMQNGWHQVFNDFKIIPNTGN